MKNGEDGFNRLLIAGFKCEIGHPNVTNDELRLMQDEALVTERLTKLALRRAGGELLVFLQVIIINEFTFEPLMISIVQ